jgi:hypothetical protein
MAKLETVQIKEIDLNKLCAKANLTLKQLAEKAKVNYRHLDRVNKGHYRMSTAYWDKLKNALDNK